MSVDTLRRRGRGRPPVGKPFGTKLYPHQKALLQQMAEVYGLDMADIMREALDEKLAKMRRQARAILDAA